MLLYYISLFLSTSFLLLHAQRNIDINSRINCHPEPGVDQENCQNRGCVYDGTSNSISAPKCYYPPDTGYILESSGTNTATLKKSPTSVKNPYGQDFDELIFSWNEIGSGLHVSISPNGQNRYRPPLEINENPNIISTDKLVLSTQNNSIFSFVIKRQSTGTNIWDTSLGGLLFADQYLQLVTKLPSDKIYGFGEQIHQSLKHDLSLYRTWGMYTRNQAPLSWYGNEYINYDNMYGAQPFYFGLEEDGSAHGVFIYNSNAQEVTLGPAPHLTYRTIGGQLEFFFFPGPTPEEVIQQYQQSIGKPFLPAYWSLGFGLSHYGYNNLEELIAGINRTIEAGIPIDVVFDGIDCMDQFKDFTIDHTNWGGLPNYTDWIHQNDMHLILAFDPAIEVDYDVFERALQRNVSFIEWPSDDLVPPGINSHYPMTNGTKIMLGDVWPPQKVAFPDFLDPMNNTNEWWIDEFVRFHNVVQFDGIWLDMDEPTNSGTEAENDTSTNKNEQKYPLPVLKCPWTGNNSIWDHPPYQTVNAYQYGNISYYNKLFSMSLCNIGTSNRGGARLYDTHNLYGWSIMRATTMALKKSTGKRGTMFSRSTFAASGRYGGHWFGDSYSKWADLQTSIISAQEFNLFGIPYNGGDICGFEGNTTEELCLRWQQLGAFYSFSRNHNNKGDILQDPGQWPSVAQAARKANLFRYRHLPYLFSLHFSASLYGGTVVRPVFFEFPNDNVTHTLSYQFLWGSALMIAPVVYQNATTIDGYLPPSAIWYSVYDYFYGSQVNSSRQTFYAPKEYLIPVFVRGGYILPRQRPAMTTVATRRNEFQLLVALDKNLQAQGELYWDDGESIVPNDDLSQHNYYHFVYNFTATQQSGSLTITRERDATNLPLKTLDNIEIFGYPYQPNLKLATLNGQPININTQTSSYSPFTKVLNITTTGLIDLNINGPTWILSWTNF